MFSIKNLFDQAANIKMHNHIFELIEEQISYDISRSFSAQAQNDTGKTNEVTHRMTRGLSFSADKMDDIQAAGLQGGLQGYFGFIDFVQLQVK
jgi:hypothetical protein